MYSNLITTFAEFSVNQLVQRTAVKSIKRLNALYLSLSHGSDSTVFPLGHLELTSYKAIRS